MRFSMLTIALAAGMLLPTAPFADRDRFVTGSAIGVAPGKSTGGLADYSLIGTLPGGMMLGSSGRCYAWTQSGRLVRAVCP